MSQAHEIYYKGNPITSKNYIPQCSRQNRIQKKYLVQFPQGKNYFDTKSRKRQYASLHHQSQIKDIHLFEEERNPHYEHSNLQVSDIEGATTNTIVPQAMKNRMNKTRFKYKHKNTDIQRNRNRVETEELENYLKAYNQKYQPNEVNEGSSHRERGQNRQQNYHFKRARVYTQPNQYASISKHSNEAEFPQKQQPIHSYLLDHKISHDQLRSQNPQSSHDHPQTVTPQFRNYTKLNPSHQTLGLQSTNDNRRTNSKSFQQAYQPQNRSIQELKKLRHGDNRKIQYYDQAQIRKFNPTYISENYAGCINPYAGYQYRM